MSSHLQNPRDPWTRLTAAARTVRDQRETAAPYGFATRVAALAFAQERKMTSLFNAFALRALGVAGLLAAFSVALNYSELTTPSGPAVAANDEQVVLHADDAVAVVLDLAD
jgi:hypothetical protein